MSARRKRHSPFRREKIRLWNGLMKNLIEIKEYDRAKRLCRRIADLQPHDAMIRYRLLELALVTHDARDPAASLAELDRVLHEIDDIAGQGPLWMYGKAVRLTLEAAQGKPELLDAAMDYAEQAQQMRLSWSRPHVLQGEICRQRGKDEEALEHYLQASINGDRDLEFIRTPVANALRAAALPGGRAGDPSLGQQPNAPDPRDQRRRGR